jgi:hypothetical protein
MCLYGNLKLVKVLNQNQNNKYVKVDACIANEIQSLNDKGIITLNCCCGHGKAGQILEYENLYGKWKEYQSPPVVLIDNKSVEQAKKFGYLPFPYFSADGEGRGIWQMQLKSGCLTEEECKEWHSQNTIPYEKNLGIISV